MGRGSRQRGKEDGGMKQGTGRCQLHEPALHKECRYWVLQMCANKEKKKEKCELQRKSAYNSPKHTVRKPSQDTDIDIRSSYWNRLEHLYNMQAVVNLGVTAPRTQPLPLCPAICAGSIPRLEFLLSAEIMLVQEEKAGHTWELSQKASRKFSGNYRQSSR